MDDKMIRKLSEDDLDQVSGGQIFDASNIIGHEDGRPWEVLNDKGEVVGRASNRDEAIWIAGQRGVSRDEVKTWDEVRKMRGQ